MFYDPKSRKPTATIDDVTITLVQWSTLMLLYRPNSMRGKIGIGKTKLSK